jgi:hypothetical protein
MFEDAGQLMEAVEQNGELHVVLDSDREYVLHTHDTEAVNDKLVRTEGIEEGGNEYMVVQFPAGAVEHTYIHRET